MAVVLMVGTTEDASPLRGTGQVSEASGPVVTRASPVTAGQVLAAHQATYPGVNVFVGAEVRPVPAVSGGSAA
jgi:hypothetical protein